MPRPCNRCGGEADIGWVEFDPAAEATTDSTPNNVFLNLRRNYL